MRISTMRHFAGDAAKSLNRNKTISTASAATVAATLFILGVFLLTILNVKQGIKEVESKIEVKIFLKDDISDVAKQQVEEKIKNTPGVADIQFETKEQALEKLKEQLGEQNQGLVEGLDKDNPMPNSYIVRVEKPQFVADVVSNVKYLPGIDQVKDGRDLVNKLMTVTNTLKWVGIILFAILIGVSLFLIGNTIKLTVYSRRREIGIMKFIGATDWFIRWPFLMEGAVIGFLGSIIAIALLYYGYRFVYAKAASALVIMNLVSPSYVLGYISWEFVVGGIIIGVLGSVLSIRKFLAV